MSKKVARRFILLIAAGGYLAMGLYKFPQPLTDLFSPTNGLLIVLGIFIAKYIAIGDILLVENLLNHTKPWYAQRCMIPFVIIVLVILVFSYCVCGLQLLGPIDVASKNPFKAYFFLFTAIILFWIIILDWRPGLRKSFMDNYNNSP